MGVKILSMRILGEDSLEEAASLLKAGEVVAFPTETVFGLGASIFSEKGIQEIFRVKGRPADNPLIAHISSLADVAKITQDLPPSFSLLAERFFPGPLTLVVKKHPHVPGIASGGLSTLGVRMPDLDLARKLIELVGAPLVAPSANLSGRPSATELSHVIEDFAGKIAAAIEGRCKIGVESTILLLEPEPLLLRPGEISQEEIEEVLGKKIAKSSKETPLLAPGMRYRHYAPRGVARFFTSDAELQAYILKAPISKRHIFIATKERLYYELRYADSLGAEEVLILYEGDDPALLNRLLKVCE